MVVQLYPMKARMIGGGGEVKPSMYMIYLDLQYVGLLPYRAQSQIMLNRNLSPDEVEAIEQHVKKKTGRNRVRTVMPGEPPPKPEPDDEFEQW